MRFSLWIIVALLSIHSLVASADSAWSEDSWTQATRADLTGDGKKEAVRLEPFFGKVTGSQSLENYFRLTINGHQIYDLSLWGKVQGFRLVNTNRRDRWKEIQVAIPDGEWRQFFIYWFDGKTIHRVTRESLTWMRFIGNGQASTSIYQGSEITGQVFYDLQTNHTLRRRNQKYYAVGINETVKEPFPIYSRPGNKRIAMLHIGTKVRILKSDLGDWLYVRAGRSTYGWMNRRWNSEFAAFGIVAAG